MTNGPVLFDLDGTETEAPDVATAPPVPDQPQGQAMQTAARIATAKPSRLSRWFWAVLLAVLGAILSVAVWDFATSLMTRVPVLGWAMTGLLALLILLGLALAVRELAALSRLRKTDGLRRAADTALADRDLAQAQKVAQQLVAFYSGREDTRWGRDRLRERQGEQFDATAVFALAEDELLAPMDAAAQAEVEAAARQVATVTALVPMALADVVVALSSSLRMIRRIAEIYGGRSGTLGSWRLVRAVLSHLVATGAIAVGDDLLEPVLGGSILGKLSRRFGEGLVNGALSVRVGIAAMEVCRPLPFSDRHRPSTRAVIGRALKGIVSKSE